MNLSLTELFASTFGYNSQAFDPEFNKLPARVEQSATGAPYWATDTLGREYFMPVTLTYQLSTDTGINGDSFTEAKTFNLPNSIVSITARKTIIETALVERSGTFKELINIQDYDINVKGFLISATNDFPERDMVTLGEIFEVPAAISLRSAITDIWLLRPYRDGSDNVVIKEMDFPAVAGVQNVRAYEIRFVSDAPFNVTQIN